MRANHLPAGAMPEIVGSYKSSTWRDRPAAYASGIVFDLERLAALSGNELAAIESLTFAPVLRRIYGTPNPSIRSLGQIPFALCPVCWRSDQELHRLAAFLPGANACDRHLVGLFNACTCGVPLSPAPATVGRCGSCALRWSDLRETELSAADADQHRRLTAAYAEAFGVPAGSGTRVFGEMLRHLRDRRTRAKQPAMPLWLRAVSIERMVSLFMALGGDEGLAEVIRRPGEPLPCPNAACLRFDLAGCNDAFERHCRVCGTRFVGQRILSTFDVDHGQPAPSVQRVRRARRRLARWRIELRRACTALADANEPVTVMRAFPLAGVPLNANLRAPRLGLTEIVRAAEARRRGSLPDARPIGGAVLRKVLSHDIDWLSAWARAERQRRAIPESLFRPLRPFESYYEFTARIVAHRRLHPGLICSLPADETRFELD